MGFLSYVKKLNLGFGMPYMPKTTSAATMEVKEFKEVEHVSTVPLAGDHHENAGVDKDTRVRSDETGSCEFGMDWKSNHPSREENVEGKPEKVVSGQRKLTKLKGDWKQGNIASSEKIGQMECKLNFMGLPIRPGEKKCPFYMRTGGCKFAGHCRFHHPEPTAEVGDSSQDRKNDAPSQHHGQVEQFCKTPKPLGNTSDEQTALLGPLTPNQGLQQNVHWNGNQTSSSPLHAREMNINDFNGGVKSQQFDEYPQRPGEPECQYFRKTGCCKFKSSCRYHHPKSKYCDPIEHLCVTPLSLESTSEKQTAILGPSLSYVPDQFTSNQGFKSNSQWNENQTITSPLHPPDIRTTDKQQELSNKDAASEFSGGEPQQFDEYPQRPSEPECQYFMKTGYCKFKSACRYHHPKSNLSSLRPASNNKVPLQQDDPAEQLCEITLPMENTSNDQTAFLCPSSSATPVQENVQWNGYQTITSLLHPPHIRTTDKQQELSNKDAASEFSGGAPQQFDEYPQRPSEPECQYFMKTGYCKFKSACRYHHPKSNLSSLRPASNNSVPLQQDDPVEQLCEITLPTENTSNDRTAFLCPPSAATPVQENVQWNGYKTITSLLHPPDIRTTDKQKELSNKDAASEFSGGVPQQFDEYPQRPSEPECQYFMKTGYCKFKSACRYHHPKSNLSSLRPASNNSVPLQQDDPVEQLCEITLPTENPSNDRTAFLCPSSSATLVQENVQWNGFQTSLSPLHAREMNINEFKGGVKSQPDEYPQKPGEPECQYFMKTGYCKFKSACRYHHPKWKCRGPVEQLGRTLLTSENTSEEQEAVVGLSSSNVPDLFTPNQRLESNAQYNENQTGTSLLHPPDIKTIDQQQQLVNKDAASEFSGGEPQLFDEYPQRPSEPECQYFMKTGYCKFKSACRYHHPKSNFSSLSLSLRPASKNSVPFQQGDPVEQLCEITLPSENTSNDQTAFLCPSSSEVPGQANVQWNGDQMATSPLHPPEIKMNLKGQELANKDTAREFNGRVESQQFDEYPQRPGEPECQHFMKTGYCKFKSACRCHHPKSNSSFPARPLKPDKPTCTHYSRRGICKFGSACRFNHHIEHTYVAPAANAENGSR